MFLIAAHNKDSYLDKVESILKDKGIDQISRVRRDSLRVPIEENNRLIKPCSADFDKVVIATVRRQKFSGLYEALNSIRNSPELKQEEGFITTLSYEDIIEKAQGRKEVHMEISDYLKVRFVCMQLQSTNKQDSIKELTDLLNGCPEVNDHNNFVKDVLAREEIQSTGIGNCIAFPHARSHAVDKFVIAIGRSSQGIDFSAIDGQPVNLIFLMGIPIDTVKGYLKVLAFLTRLLKKNEFRKQLLEAKNEREIITIFENITL